MTEYRMVKRSRDGSADEYGIECLIGDDWEGWPVYEGMNGEGIDMWTFRMDRVEDEIARLRQEAKPWTIEVLEY